jgi:hypothetical protein
MRRHAPYGPPEVFAEVVDGRGAFYFAWTDGVMDVGTWWVQLEERVAARIEYGDPKSGLLSAPRVPPPREAARALIAGLSFTARD